MLSLEKSQWIPGAYAVSSVPTDEDYRGRGLGHSLYGIALSILGLTLVSDAEQTSGGRSMWKIISNIPGVDIKGFTKATDNKTKQLLKQQGAQPLTGDYWTFPIKQGKHELKSTIPDIPMYHNQFAKDVPYHTIYRTGLIAKWNPVEVETVDVDAIHAESLREHLLSNPALYESRDDFNDMRSFLDTHKTPTPVIGNQYVYASVSTTPVMDRADIAHFTQRHKLVKLDDNYAYFDINGMIKRFPETGTLSGDALSQIYFFNSSNDLSKFNTLLNLKFSNYKIGSKTLDEQKIREVTTVPTVAKGKRAHLDVMPNDGKPIPAGEEEHYMGSKLGRIGSNEVWTYNQGPMKTFVVFNPVTRVSQLAVTGSSYPNNPDSLIIKGVYSGPENITRAVNLYAWLITKQGLTLVSDIKQSPGGQRVWQDLEKQFGRFINIHGFNTKTNQPVNVGAQDDTETHVDQAQLTGATRDVKDTANNIRLVASPK